jgi:hypothetical protein
MMYCYIYEEISYLTGDVIWILIESVNLSIWSEFEDYISERDLSKQNECAFDKKSSHCLVCVAVLPFVFQSQSEKSSRTEISLIL